MVPTLTLGHPPADITEQSLKVELLVDSKEEQKPDKDHPERGAGLRPLVVIASLPAPDDGTGECRGKVGECGEPAKGCRIADPQVPLAVVGRGQKPDVVHDRGLSWSEGRA